MTALYYINFGVATAAFFVACLTKESTIAWILFFNAVVSLHLANVWAKNERNIK